jgi:hypothetical protein
MNTMKKTAAGAVLGGALLAAGGLGLAHAAPPAQSVVSDGNVNVTVTAGGQQVGVIRDVSLPLRARLPGSPRRRSRPSTPTAPRCPGPARALAAV